MKIRRGSVVRHTGEKEGGGEAAVYTTAEGAADVSRLAWSVVDGRLILDPAGQPMVRNAAGFTVLQEHATYGMPVRTTRTGGKILVY